MDTPINLAVSGASNPTQQPLLYLSPLSASYSSGSLSEVWTTYADEVQTIEAHGIHRTEYRYEPEHPTDLENCYAPDMILIHQGERDKLDQIPPRFPANTEYLRGYKAPGAYYLTEIQDDSAERNHFLITLVHRRTEEEKLVDLLTDTDEFGRICNIVNCHFDRNWCIFEVLDLEEPF